MNNKIHHCFNCGEETEDYEELPNGQKFWCCNEKECNRELRQVSREIEAEARERAEMDKYHKYY